MKDNNGHPIVEIEGQQWTSYCGHPIVESDNGHPIVEIREVK